MTEHHTLHRPWTLCGEVLHYTVGHSNVQRDKTHICQNNFLHHWKAPTLRLVVEEVVILGDIGNDAETVRNFHGHHVFWVQQSRNSQLRLSHFKRLDGGKRMRRQKKGGVGEVSGSVCTTIISNIRSISSNQLYAYLYVFCLTFLVQLDYGMYLTKPQILLFTKVRLSLCLI